ncbi:MAG TPA: copper-binding protein [Candidatus Kapabacteria bacterium]|jgi:Cu/Ag efflux protein CusF|nr:copper-binding protein [Candidatus Kapabacteria bacterium]
MTVSKMYAILGMAIVGGLTIAGVSAESPEPIAAVSGGGHEGHDHGDGGTADEGGAAAEGHAKDMATYTFKGVVTAIDVENKKITLKHEKIGDYMEAMTMPFDVADPAMFESLKVGDEKAFILHVNPSMTALVGFGPVESADAAATGAHAGCAGHKDGEKCAEHKDGEECTGHKDGEKCAGHKDGEKCAEHKDGQACKHDGKAGGDACCAKHAKEGTK